MQVYIYIHIHKYTYTYIYLDMYISIYIDTESLVVNEKLKYIAIQEVKLSSNLCRCILVYIYNIIIIYWMQNFLKSKQ